MGIFANIQINKNTSKKCKSARKKMNSKIFCSSLIFYFILFLNIFPTLVNSTIESQKDQNEEELVANLSQSSGSAGDFAEGNNQNVGESASKTEITDIVSTSGKENEPKNAENLIRAKEADPELPLPEYDEMLNWETKFHDLNEEGEEKKSDEFDEKIEENLEEKIARDNEKWQQTQKDEKMLKKEALENIGTILANGIFNDRINSFAHLLLGKEEMAKLWAAHKNNLMDEEVDSPEKPFSQGSSRRFQSQRHNSPVGLSHRFQLPRPHSKGSFGHSSRSNDSLRFFNEGKEMLPEGNQNRDSEIIEEINVPETNLASRSLLGASSRRGATRLYESASLMDSYRKNSASSVNSPDSSRHFQQKLLPDFLAPINSPQPPIDRRHSFAHLDKVDINWPKPLVRSKSDGNIEELKEGQKSQIPTKKKKAKSPKEEEIYLLKEIHRSPEIELVKNVEGLKSSSLDHRELKLSPSHQMNQGKIDNSKKPCCGPLSAKKGWNIVKKALKICGNCAMGPAHYKTKLERKAKIAEKSKKNTQKS